MTRIGNMTAKFLAANNRQSFVLPYGVDLPKRTCRKYGVMLRAVTRKNLDLQIVTVFHLF
jgi:hypothetical protein